jgi:glycosyltransferase involved in cell wall biosynthesis
MIDILLATYNGEAWLEEQIDSLLAQEFRDWRLLARDDGSSDRTVELLQSYANRFPGKILILPNHGDNLGPCGNFTKLLEFSNADYVMFCDQDDIWLPEKIGVTLVKMQEMEAAHGLATPFLVHTDFKLVDEKLQVFAESGWQYQKTEPKRMALNRLLVQNVATGCTVMINRTLREIARPIPPGALMHDWWLALVASVFGKIGQLAQPTMLYRQHAANKVGAQNWNAAYILGLVSQLSLIRAVMARNRTQARAFYECYQASLGKREKALLEAFFLMPERGMLRRRFDICRYHIFYGGFVRNLGWLVLC